MEIEKGWWQSLLKILQDSFVIVPKAALPTKEKEALKKAFGAFNTGFEQVGCWRCDCPARLHRRRLGLKSGWRVLNLFVFQVFAELKQMTIPSTALRSEVVSAIGDTVVRTCSFRSCAPRKFTDVCRCRSTQFFTTGLPIWTFRRRGTREP